MLALPDKPKQVSTIGNLQTPVCYPTEFTYRGSNKNPLHTYVRHASRDIDTQLIVDRPRHTNGRLKLLYGP